MSVFIHSKFRSFLFNLIWWLCYFVIATLNGVKRSDSALIATYIRTIEVALCRIAIIDLYILLLVQKLIVGIRLQGWIVMILIFRTPLKRYNPFGQMRAWHEAPLQLSLPLLTYTSLLGIIQWIEGVGHRSKQWLLFWYFLSLRFILVYRASHVVIQHWKQYKIRRRILFMRR